MITLHHLLLSFDVEIIFELSSFYAKANSLLDCAAILGLKAEELQQWESLCRNVECVVFDIDYITGGIVRNAH